MIRDKIRDLWWVQALLFGAVFGIVTGVFAAHRHHGSGLTAGLAAGPIGGVLFGLAMGWVTRRQLVARDRRTAAVTAELTAEHRTQAVRASRRGPIPDDPAIRVAAAGLTHDDLEQSLSYRSKNLTIFSIIAVLELLLALTSSRWYWLTALVFAALIVAQLRQPQALRRRLALLNPTADFHQ